jgi:hypothetical protein
MKKDLAAYGRIVCSRLLMRYEIVGSVLYHKHTNSILIGAYADIS